MSFCSTVNPRSKKGPEFKHENLVPNVHSEKITKPKFRAFTQFLSLKKLWCCVGGRMKQKCVFFKRVDKSRITTVKDSESWHFERKPFVIYSNEGLTIETSAFLIFHAFNLTFVNWLDKTKFLFRAFALRLSVRGVDAQNVGFRRCFYGGDLTLRAVFK